MADNWFLSDLNHIQNEKSSAYRNFHGDLLLFGYGISAKSKHGRGKLLRYISLHFRNTFFPVLVKCLFTETGNQVADNAFNVFNVVPILDCAMGHLSVTNSDWTLCLRISIIVDFIADIALLCIDQLHLKSMTMNYRFWRKSIARYYLNATRYDGSHPVVKIILTNVRILPLYIFGL